uniref:Large ribosomal subunit protein bL21c n=1 Tax=Dipteris conjugata TaxID=32108 RepID=A0A0B5E837_9MONI|nr:ribosomal protein L21 [Dipteris conjugata]
MDRHAAIDTGGKQLRVEPGRFYDVRHFALLGHNASESNTVMSIYRVSLVCHGSKIDLGHPRLSNATARGRVLHPCSERKKVIRKIHSKKKTRRKSGYRQDLVRSVVDPICLNGKELVG